MDSNHQLDVYQRVFHVFSRSRDGTADIKNLSSMLRQAGIDADDAVVDELIVRHSGGLIRFEEYVELCESARERNIPRETLVAAFKVFDPTDTGSLSIKILKTILGGTSGEMSSEEIDYAIAQLNPDPDGNIKYHSFIDRMYPRKGQ